MLVGISEGELVGISEGELVGISEVGVSEC